MEGTAFPTSGIYKEDILGLSDDGECISYQKLFTFLDSHTSKTYSDLLKTEHTAEEQAQDLKRKLAELEHDLEKTKRQRHALSSAREKITEMKEVLIQLEEEEEKEDLRDPVSKIKRIIQQIHTFIDASWSHHESKSAKNILTKVARTSAQKNKPDPVYKYLQEFMEKTEEERTFSMLSDISKKIMEDLNK